MQETIIEKVGLNNQFHCNWSEDAYVLTSSKNGDNATWYNIYRASNKNYAISSHIHNSFKQSFKKA